MIRKIASINERRNNSFRSTPKIIRLDDWIIATIRIHIIASQIPIGIDIHIRIQEPAPLGIIVSRLQIIQVDFRVVVIPTIAERVDFIGRITLSHIPRSRCRSDDIAPRTVRMPSSLYLKYAMVPADCSEMLFNRRPWVQLYVYVP